MNEGMNQGMIEGMNKILSKEWRNEWTKEGTRIDRRNERRNERRKELRNARRNERRNERRSELRNERRSERRNEWWGEELNQLRNRTVALNAVCDIWIFWRYVIYLFMYIDPPSYRCPGAICHLWIDICGAPGSWEACVYICIYVHRQSVSGRPHAYTSLRGFFTASRTDTVMAARIICESLADKIIWWLTKFSVCDFMEVMWCLRWEAMYIRTVHVLELYHFLTQYSSFFEHFYFFYFAINALVSGCETIDFLRS